MTFDQFKNEAIPEVANRCGVEVDAVLALVADPKNSGTKVRLRVWNSAVWVGCAFCHVAISSQAFDASIREINDCEYGKLLGMIVGCVI